MAQSKVSLFSQIETHELPSGLHVYLKEDHRSPLVAMILTVGAGSRTEGPWAGTGISHLIEHLVFDGSHQGSDSKIGEKIERFGGEINAYTTPDFTMFYICLPNEHIEAGLEVLSDAIQKSSFDSLIVEREKQVVLHEIQMGEDDPERVLNKFFWKTAYKVHPYRIKTIGYDELLLGLTPEDLLQYFQKMYVPENMSLTLVGDFDSKGAYASIEKRFSPFKRRTFLAPLVPQEPRQYGIQRGEISKEGELARLIIGFHIPEFRHPDMAALDVLVTILGDGTQSRLNQRLKEDLKIARTVEATTTSLLDPGLLAVGVLSSDENLEVVEHETLTVLNQLKNSPMDSKELERAKSRILSNLYQQLESVEKQAYWIGVASLLTGDAGFLDTYIEAVGNVTTDDLLRVANKYLIPENEVICALRPSIPSSKDSKPQASFNRSYKKEMLSNGLTVLIGEDPSIPLVSIEAVWRGGVLAEDEKNNGIFQLLAATAIRGTTSKSSQEILGDIEAVGGDINGYSSQNSFGISIRVPSSYAGKAVKLLSEIAADASFPEGEMNQEKMQSLSMIQQIEESPIIWGAYQLKKNLFQGHPYGMMNYGTRESLKKLTREDLVKMYRQYCRPDQMILSVCGDVSSSKMMAQIQEFFGSLKKTDGGVPLPHSGMDLKGPIVVNLDRDQKQSVILMGFLVPPYSDPDRYYLELLASLFSGFGSPLFAKIRDEMGAAYYVGAYNQFGFEPGAFILYVGTSPGKEDKVIAAIEEALENVKAGLISPENFSRAKNQLLGNKLRDLEALSSRAREAALMELYGLGIGELDQYPGKIRALKIEDLIRVAKQVLRDGSKVTLVVRPKDLKKIQTSKE